MSNSDNRERRSEVTPLVANLKQLRKPIEPSTSRKASVLISAVAMQMISSGAMYSLPVFYPELIAAFDSKRSDAVLVQSLFAGICHGGGIIWSPLIRRFGPGPCSIIGGLICAVAFGVNLVATDLNMIIITVGLIAVVALESFYRINIVTAIVAMKLLSSVFSPMDAFGHVTERFYCIWHIYNYTGLGMSCCYLTPYICVGWTFRADPGNALTSLTMGLSLGQLIFPYLTEIFIQQYQWRGAFLLCGALTANLLVFALVLHQSRDYFDSDAGSHQPNSEGKTSKCPIDLTLFKNVEIAVILTTCFLVALTGNMEAWFMVDILVSRGFERKQGSLIVSLTGLAMLVGRVIAFTMQIKCRIPSMYHLVYTFSLVGLGHVAVINTRDYWLILVMAFVTTLCNGFGAALIPAVMYEASGLERYPQGMSLVNLAYGLGSFSVGPLGGSIRDNYGDYSPMFYLGLAAGIFISLTTGIVTFIMTRRYRQNDQEILVK